MAAHLAKAWEIASADAHEQSLAGQHTEWDLPARHRDVRTFQGGATSVQASHSQRGC